MNQHSILLSESFLDCLHTLIKYALNILRLDILGKIRHVFELAWESIDADVGCHIYDQTDVVFLQLFITVGCLFSRNIDVLKDLNTLHVGIVWDFCQLMQIMFLQCVKLGIKLAIFLTIDVTFLQFT